MNIHVYKDDQQLGPYSVEEVQALLREGTLAHGDLALMEGSDSFTPLGSLVGQASGPSSDPGKGE